MNQENPITGLLSGNGVKLQHEFDWDDMLKIGSAIFVAVVLGIIVGHSILNALK